MSSIVFISAIFARHVCVAGREASNACSASCKSIPEAAAAQLASHVMTAPELVSQLPSAARKQMKTASTVKLIAAALTQLASDVQPNLTNHQGKPTISVAAASHSSSSQHDISGQKGVGKHACGKAMLEGSAAAMCALGNMAALLCADRVSKATQVTMRYCLLA